MVENDPTIVNAKSLVSKQSAEDMVRNDGLGSYKAEYSFLDRLGPDSWIPRICRGLRTGTAGRPPKKGRRP